MDLADFRGRAGQNEINNKRVMIGAYLCSVPTTGGMRLAFGRGIVSDDTEHAFLVGQSLLVASGDVAAFRRALAGRLRWWFLGLPAGVGLATARACVKLCLGISPERSGVYSAGNGPAIRSASIGAYFWPGILPRNLVFLVISRP